MRYLLASHPAVRLFVCAVAGILASRAFPVLPGAWLALSLAASLLTLALALSARHRPGRHVNLSPAVACYLLAVAGFFALHASYRFTFVPAPSLLSWVGRQVILSGVVEGRPDATSGGSGFLLRVTELFHDGRSRRLDDRADIFVRVSPDSEFRIEEGEFIRVKGRPGLISPAANRGEYDPRTQARYRRVHVQVFCPGPWCLQREVLSKKFSLYRSLVNPLRRYLAGSIDGRFPPGMERQFVKGMILGELELLPDGLSEAFRRTGTAHVIAVSGLHVALLAWAVNLCLQRLRITSPGRWVAFILFITVLALYCLVTGNAPSIRRAAIMSAIMIGGNVLGRRSFALNSLAVSDLLILLFDPFDLFSAGFLMTNMAVVGILLLHRPLSGLVPKGPGVARRTVGALWSAFSVSLSAMAGVSPVIAFMFGVVSPSGIVANIPVVFFSNLAMYASLPLFLFHGFGAWPASLFAESSWIFARLTILFTLFFSRLPMAAVDLKPDLFEVGVWYASVAAMLFFLLRRSWGRAAVALLFGVNVALVYVLTRPWQEPPGIVTVNLGRDVAVLFSTCSETVLVDSGRKARRWQRIVRQADVWRLARPSAAVSFMSPDSVVNALPVPRKLDSSGRALVLRSAVVTRLGERVLRIDSRKRSLLLVSGIGRLEGASVGKVDLAMIWVYRFTGKQWRALDAWIDAALPARVVLVPGAFMSSAQRGLLVRYAASRKGISVRSGSVQTVIP